MAKLLSKKFVKKDYHKDFSVFLYDLEVDKDESYIVDGIIVHNSHCAVCPEMEKRIWTWQTLPFVPRDGSTPCLYKCCCSLEIQSKIKIGTLGDIPGSSTAGALNAAGRFARVFTEEGVEVGGAAQSTVEDLYAQMYKARQMIEITEGEELKDWIKIRIGLNQNIIDFLEGRKYRAVPTVSVSDLVKTIKGAVGMPETELLKDYAEYTAGREVLFVRANFSSYGKLAILANRLSFINGKGLRLPLSEDMDILFGLTDTRLMADPRKYKKFFMKIFDKNGQLYEDFLVFYDNAISSGSRIPTEAAWIAFGEKWANGPQGWVLR